MLTLPLYWPLIAALVSFPIGFAWYSPLLFGKVWTKLKGISEKEIQKAQKEMGPYYAASFAATIFQAFVLAYAINWTRIFTFTAAALTAFWLWAGFVFVTQLTNQIFSKEGLNPKLLAIDTGYQLVQLVAMALVLATLRHFGV